MILPIRRSEPPQRALRAALIPRRAVSLLLYHGSSPRVRAGLAGRPLRPPGPGRQRPRGQPPRCRPHARLDLAGVDAPRVRPRCPRLSPLWRPAARYRHRPGPPPRPGHPRPPSPLWGTEPPGPAPPPRPQSGRLLARSGPQSLTLAPLHQRLDREPVAAQDHWGPAGVLDADPRLRLLDRAVPGPPPGLTGEAGLPRRRPPAEVASIAPMRRETRDLCS